MVVEKWSNMIAAITRQRCRWGGCVSKVRGGLWGVDKNGNFEQETIRMKKETKELLRVLGVAFLLMMVVPLVYRVVIHFWPPEEKPRRTLEQFFEEAQMARCIKLLTTPAEKWSDDEVKMEPEIYAWLNEQGNEILPWEWTEEARRKDPKGYAKCWRRIWKERKSCCERLLAGHQTENKRLVRELQIITTIHAHRTNQIEQSGTGPTKARFFSAFLALA